MNDHPTDPYQPSEDSPDRWEHGAADPSSDPHGPEQGAHDPTHLGDPTDPFEGSYEFDGDHLDDHLDDHLGDLDDHVGDLNEDFDDLDDHTGGPDEAVDDLDDHPGGPNDQLGDLDDNPEDVEDRDDIDLTAIGADDGDDGSLSGEQPASGTADEQLDGDDDAVGPDEPDVGALVLDDGVEAPVEYPFDPTRLTSLMADLVVDPADVTTTLERMGLDEAPDGRCLVIAFEQLGVEARVEFGDFDRVAELLAAGVEVRLGDAGTILGIDDLTDHATLLLDGSEYRVPLVELDLDWAEHANEMILTEHDGRVLAVLPALRTRDGGISG